MSAIFADQPICSLVGCDNIVKSKGLCNTHYVALWRSQERAILEEVAKANRTFGSPADYFCEGADDCEETPYRWWVKDGEPMAYCITHAEQAIDEMRLNIRRLEVKL